MSVQEEVASNIGAIIIIIVVLMAVFYLLNSLTDGGLVRLIVCGATFWLPFGAGISSYCRAIPI